MRTGCIPFGRPIAIGASLCLMSCGQAFDREEWRRLPPSDRHALAEDWLERAAWSERSRAEIEADLGPAADVDAWRGWEVPESIALLAWPDLDPRWRIDAPRVAERSDAGHLWWDFESGNRAVESLRLGGISQPEEEVAHNALQEAVAQLPFGSGILAALSSTGHALVDLAWDAGDGGLFHERAFLHVRLVDDRAVAAWFVMH